jgi:hypothetical protein
MDSQEILIKLIASQLSFLKQDDLAKSLTSKFNLQVQPASNRLAELLDGYPFNTLML